VKDSEENKVLVFADNMQNDTDRLYFAWPERLYIIHDSKIAFKGELGPHGYHPEEVDEWLSKFKQSS